MDIEKKVLGQKFLLDAQEELLKEYEKELKRLQIKNLKLKLDMQVLVSHPDIKAAAEMREKYRGDATFKESVLHYN